MLNEEAKPNTIRVQHITGDKIELYTTKTINESYKRKVNAITGISDVSEYYTFRYTPYPTKKF